MYPRGVELHTDGRIRRRDWLGVRTLESPFPKGGGPRGQIRGFTKESRRRLAWVLANAPTDFAVHLTVTCHARVDESDGVQVAKRNPALVQRAKTDMNRFLAAIGKEAGRYVWIQEFQKRGANDSRCCSNRRPAALAPARHRAYAAGVNPVGRGTRSRVNGWNGAARWRRFNS